MASLTVTPSLENREAMDEEEFLREIVDVPRAKNEYTRCRMILAYYFGRLEMADRFSQNMPDDKEEGSVAMVPMHHLYKGLIVLALARKTGSLSCRRRAATHIRQIRNWVKKGNPNCHHMLLLLQAERLSLSRRNRKHQRARTQKEYDDAIASAARAGFLHHQALGNERAALFFLECKDFNWASWYFSNARKLYQDYGALAKVKDVEEHCGRLQLNLERSPKERSSAFLARERLSQHVMDMPMHDVAFGLQSEEFEPTQTSMSSSDQRRAPTGVVTFGDQPTVVSSLG